jgi:TetR/AcrR family transcriptional regulator, mexJK operon transcriptional repressor
MTNGAGHPKASERRRSERRDAILTIAAGLFRKHGYARTTMSEISKTMGGSKGTLWRHFKSKEDLYASVVDHETTTFCEGLRNIVDPNSDGISPLRKVCTGILDEMTSPAVVMLHRLVIAEAGNFPNIGKLLYDRTTVHVCKYLEDFLPGPVECNICDADRPAAARLLFSLLLAGCYQHLLIGILERAHPKAIAADVDRAVDVFLNLYTPVSPKPVI